MPQLIDLGAFKMSWHPIDSPLTITLLCCMTPIQPTEAIGTDPDIRSRRPYLVGATATIPATHARPLPSEIDSLHTRALAIILPDIDALVHGATEWLAVLAFQHSNASPRLTRQIDTSFTSGDNTWRLRLVFSVRHEVSFV